MVYEVLLNMFRCANMMCRQEIIVLHSIFQRISLLLGRELEKANRKGEKTGGG